MGANVSSVTASYSAQRQLIGALIETRIDCVYALSFNLVFRDPVRSIRQQSTCRTTIDLVATGVPPHLANRDQGYPTIAHFAYGLVANAVTC
jgi:hypothetical protein